MEKLEEIISVVLTERKPQLYSIFRVATFLLQPIIANGI